MLGGLSSCIQEVLGRDLGIVVSIIDGIGNVWTSRTEICDEEVRETSVFVVGFLGDE